MTTSIYDFMLPSKTSVAIVDDDFVRTVRTPTPCRAFHIQGIPGRLAVAVSSSETQTLIYSLSLLGSFVKMMLLILLSLLFLLQLISYTDRQPQNTYFIFLILLYVTFV